MGAFAYSHETGTYAHEHYPDDVPDDLKHERLDCLMRLQERIAGEQHEAKIGLTFRTLIDREEDGFYVGRTEFDSPEIDPEVLVLKEQKLRIGHFYRVRIESAEAFELYGKALKTA
jgi:ribosomal protein S12 methylthiotransferase